MKPFRTFSRLLFAFCSRPLSAASPIPPGAVQRGAVVSPKPPDAVVTYNVSGTAQPRRDASSNGEARARSPCGSAGRTTGSRLRTAPGRAHDHSRSFGELSGSDPDHAATGQRRGPRPSSSRRRLWSPRASRPWSTELRIDQRPHQHAGDLLRRLGDAFLGKPRRGTRSSSRAAASWAGPRDLQRHGGHGRFGHPSRIRVITPWPSRGVPVGVGQTGTATSVGHINVNENGQTRTPRPGLHLLRGCGPAGQPLVFPCRRSPVPTTAARGSTIVGSGFREPCRCLGLGTTVESFDGVEATVRVGDG